MPTAFVADVAVAEEKQETVDDEAMVAAGDIAQPSGPDMGSEGVMAGDGAEASCSHDATELQDAEEINVTEGGDEAGKEHLDEFDAEGMAGRLDDFTVAVAVATGEDVTGREKVARLLNVSLQDVMQPWEQDRLVEFLQRLRLDFIALQWKKTHKLSDKFLMERRNSEPAICTLGVLGTVDVYGQFLVCLAVVATGFSTSAINLRGPATGYIVTKRDNATIVLKKQGGLILAVNAQRLWGIEHTQEDVYTGGEGGQAGIVLASRIPRVVQDGSAVGVDSDAADDLRCYEQACAEVLESLRRLEKQTTGDEYSFCMWSDGNYAFDCWDPLMLLEVKVSSAVQSLFVPMGASSFGGERNAVFPREIIQPESINSRKIVSGGKDRLKASGNGILYTCYGGTKQNLNLTYHSYYAVPFVATGSSTMERCMRSAVPATTTSSNNESELDLGVAHPSCVGVDQVLRKFVHGLSQEAVAEALEKVLQHFPVHNAPIIAEHENEEDHGQRKQQSATTIKCVFLFAVFVRYLQIKFNGLRDDDDWIRLFEKLAHCESVIVGQLFSNRTRPPRLAVLTRVSKILFRAAVGGLSLGYIDGLGRIAAVSYAVMNRIPTDDVSEIQASMDAEVKLGKVISTKKTGETGTLKIVFRVFAEDKEMSASERSELGQFSKHLQVFASSATKISIVDFLYNLVERQSSDLSLLIPPELMAKASKPHDVNNKWLNERRVQIAREFEKGRSSCLDIDRQINRFVNQYKKAMDGSQTDWIMLLETIQHKEPGEKLLKYTDVDLQKNFKFRFVDVPGTKNKRSIVNGGGLSYLINYVAQSCWSLMDQDQVALNVAKNFLNASTNNDAAVESMVCLGNPRSLTLVNSTDPIVQVPKIRVLVSLDELSNYLQHRELDGDTKTKAPALAKALILLHRDVELEDADKVWKNAVLACASNSTQAQRIEFFPSGDMGSPDHMDDYALCYQYFVGEPVEALHKVVSRQIQDPKSNNFRMKEIFHKLAWSLTTCITELYNEFGASIPVPESLSGTMPNLFRILTTNYYTDDEIGRSLDPHGKTRKLRSNATSNIPGMVFALIFMAMRPEPGKEEVGEPGPLLRFLERDKWRSLCRINAKGELSPTQGKQKLGQTENQSYEDVFGPRPDWYKFWQPLFVFNPEYLPEEIRSVFPPYLTLKQTIMFLIYGIASDNEDKLQEISGGNSISLSDEATTYDEQVLSDFSAKSHWVTLIGKNIVQYEREIQADEAKKGPSKKKRAKKPAKKDKDSDIDSEQMPAVGETERVDESDEDDRDQAGVQVQEGPAATSRADVPNPSVELECSEFDKVEPTVTFNSDFEEMLERGLVAGDPTFALQAAQLCIQFAMKLTIHANMGGIVDRMDDGAAAYITDVVFQRPSEGVLHGITSVLARLAHCTAKLSTETIAKTLKDPDENERIRHLMACFDEPDRVTLYSGPIKSAMDNCERIIGYLQGKCASTTSSQPAAPRAVAATASAVRDGEQAGGSLRSTETGFDPAPGARAHSTAGATATNTSTSTRAEVHENDNFNFQKTFGDFLDPRTPAGGSSPLRPIEPLRAPRRARTPQKSRQKDPPDNKKPSKQTVKGKIMPKKPPKQSKAGTAKKTAPSLSEGVVEVGTVTLMNEDDDDDGGGEKPAARTTQDLSDVSSMASDDSVAKQVETLFAQNKGGDDADTTAKPVEDEDEQDNVPLAELLRTSPRSTKGKIHKYPDSIETSPIPNKRAKTQSAAKKKKQQSKGKVTTSSRGTKDTSNKGPASDEAGKPEGGAGTEESEEVLSDAYKAELEKRRREQGSKVVSVPRNSQPNP